MMNYDDLNSAKVPLASFNKMGETFTETQNSTYKQWVI